MPELYRALSLRRILDGLPELEASPEHLGDEYLLRAAHVLSMLAHAYQYVETRPPAALPRALTKPWAEIRRRLGRDHAVLTYIDLIVYNFRFVDADAPDPYRVENMRLLTPTVDTVEERVFYLTQTEILAQTSPIVGAVVRAQQAVLDDDATGLERELSLVIERLEHVVRHSLPKIDPNPAAPTHVDPVVWARTVAPFAVPLEKGVQGPSGTSSPIFNLLDAFLGRKKNDSSLGREIRDLRRSYPRFWQEFLGAVERVSVSDYIERKGDPGLRRLLDEAIESYTGRNGFLGRHRMKVYGYLELAFKVGRSITIGGFSGLFKDRTWDQVDSELEYSRLERFESFPCACRHAQLRSSTPLSDATHAVQSVVLETDADVRVEAGDRVGVLAENGEELVQRTLDALAATGTEVVELTAEWREHVRLRPGFEGKTALSLRELLRFGRIRPVVPRVAEALHAATQDELLRAAILNQTTTRWELWDLLLELRARGYDARDLWRAEPRASNYIARVVPPENFRMYSISSAPPLAERTATELELTVGRIEYRAPSSACPELLRSGMASSFLSGAARGTPVALVLERPPRFGLPSDPRKPLVMVAGGTGIAPFMSFIRSRAQADSGEAWLYWGLRSRNDFGYQRELGEALAAGKLHLHVAFSREPATVRFTLDDMGGGHFEYVPTARAHVTELLLAEPNRRALRELVRSRGVGGQGAHLYVCGRSRFARSVDDALRRVFEDDDAQAAPNAGDRLLVELNADGRYQREIFTDPRAAEENEPSHDVSNLITKNDDVSGYWLCIDGRIYDLTSFIRMHPGGMHVLKGYAGMDATQGYLRAHPRATEVDAVREMYGIGKLRRLDFRNVSRLVDRGIGKQTLALAALYRAWVSFTYLAVEMQNALRSDIGLQFSVTTRGEPGSPRSPYRLERAIETHERFLASYMNGLAGESLVELWEVAECLCRGSASNTMVRELSRARETEAARYVAALGDDLRACLARRIAPKGAVQQPIFGLPEQLPRACEALEREAENFLDNVKALLRAGLMSFEEHEADVLTHAGSDLLRILARVPRAATEYFERVRARLSSLGFRPDVHENASSHRLMFDCGSRPELCTPHWTLERDAERNIACLRRSAAPATELAELAEQNEHIIAHLPACRGIVVDTRQAPARNDAAFERAMQRLRAEIYRRYERVAVLLVSPAGALQVERLNREDEARTLVTVSEAAAIQFAMGRS